MPKASLRGANLTHSTFRLLDLEGVLFSPSTVLNGATFDRCDLIEPSLDGVRMDYAYFLDAHFTDASFAGASFRSATFERCEFQRGLGEGADFSYATLSAYRHFPRSGPRYLAPENHFAAWTLEQVGQTSSAFRLRAPSSAAPLSPTRS
mmetsp:Transcript_37111/g.124322  ORF Transcript_37111/g.124322 Transcript_37111/m.124322 type:complete len:149 (+) Transcript_37111:561-1007(+)